MVSLNYEKSIKKIHLEHPVPGNTVINHNTMYKCKINFISQDGLKEQNNDV